MKAHLRRVVALLLTMSILFSMCITTAFAAGTEKVTVSSRMETVDEESGIYKLVFFC